MNDIYSLHKKIIIITGGAGLLAEQHALAVLEKLGTPILIDINKKKLKDLENRFKNKGYKIHTFVGDVTNFRKMSIIKKKIIKKFKRINVLVNNAQIDYVPKKEYKKKGQNIFEKYSLKKWDTEISVGLKGALICSQIFSTDMIRNKKGVILNVASDLSVIAPDQRIYSHLNSVKPITYSVIKHGLIGLTKYLASYLAEKNIRVNAISPGGVFNNQDKIFVKKIKKLIPLNRMAKVDEYKSAVQFLCSDASSYMTGQNLIMDGGRSII